MAAPADWPRDPAVGGLMEVRGKKVHLDSRISSALLADLSSRLTEAGANIVNLFSRDIDLLIVKSVASGSKGAPSGGLLTPTPGTHSSHPSSDNNAQEAKPVNDRASKGLKRGELMRQHTAVMKETEDLADIAKRLKINVQTSEKIVQWLNSAYPRREVERESLLEKTGRKPDTMAQLGLRRSAGVKPRRGKYPTIIVEDAAGLLKPFYKEFRPDAEGRQTAPQLNLKAPLHESPFYWDANNHTSDDTKAQNDYEARSPVRGAKSPQRQLRAEIVPDAVRHTQKRATEGAPPRKRATKRDAAREHIGGWCECCAVKFTDFQDHTKGKHHIAFAANASHYKAIDSLFAELDKSYRDAVDDSLVPNSAPPSSSPVRMDVDDDASAGSERELMEDDRTTAAASEAAAPEVASMHAAPNSTKEDAAAEGMGGASADDHGARPGDNDVEMSTAVPLGHDSLFALDRPLLGTHVEDPEEPEFDVFSEAPFSPRDAPPQVPEVTTTTADPEPTPMVVDAVSEPRVASPRESGPSKIVVSPAEVDTPIESGAVDAGDDRNIPSVDSTTNTTTSIAKRGRLSDRMKKNPNAKVPQPSKSKSMREKSLQSPQTAAQVAKVVENSRKTAHDMPMHEVEESNDDVIAPSDVEQTFQKILDDSEQESAPATSTNADVPWEKVAAEVLHASRSPSRRAGQRHPSTPVESAVAVTLDSLLTAAADPASPTRASPSKGKGARGGPRKPPPLWDQPAMTGRAARDTEPPTKEADGAAVDADGFKRPPARKRRTVSDAEVSPAPSSPVVPKQSPKRPSQRSPKRSPKRSETAYRSPPKRSLKSSPNRRSPGKKSSPKGRRSPAKHSPTKPAPPTAAPPPPPPAPVASASEQEFDPFASGPASLNFEASQPRHKARLLISGKKAAASESAAAPVVAQGEKRAHEEVDPFAFGGDQQGDHNYNFEGDDTPVPEAKRRRTSGKGKKGAVRSEPHTPASTGKGKKAVGAHLSSSPLEGPPKIQRQSDFGKSRR